VVTRAMTVMQYNSYNETMPMRLRKNAITVEHLPGPELVTGWVRLSIWSGRVTNLQIFYGLGDV